MSRQLSQTVQDVDVKPLWSQSENTQRTPRDSSVNFAGKANDTSSASAQSTSHCSIKTWRFLCYDNYRILSVIIIIIINIIIILNNYGWIWLLLRFDLLIYFFYLFLNPCKNEGGKN